MSLGSSIADQVAQTSIDLYGTLRGHGKPTIRPNGVEEWTILASMSLVFPPVPTSSPYTYSPSSNELTNTPPTPTPDRKVKILPVSLGTGVKVLPASRLPPLGDAVHDSHAEVLAKRGFVRWLIEEGKKAVEYELYRSTTSSGTVSESGESGSGDGKKRKRPRRGKARKKEDSSSENTPEVRSLPLPPVEEDKMEQVESIAIEQVTRKQVPTNIDKRGEIPDALTLTIRKVPGSLGWKDDPTNDPEGKKKKRKKKKSGAKRSGESSSESSPFTFDSPLPHVEKLEIYDKPIPRVLMAAAALNEAIDGEFKGKKVKSKQVTFDLQPDGPKAMGTDIQISAEISGAESSAESGSDSKKGVRRRKKALIEADIMDANIAGSEPTRPVRPRARRQKFDPDKNKEDIYVVWEDGKLRLKDGVEVWLYVSALPCGDASMLHTAAHQDPEVASLKACSSPPTPITELAPDDSIPLEKGSPITPAAPTLTHAVRGRNGYDNFGAIRTKPGRADSTPTISLSCSDKIACWAALGLQGALLEELYEPIYLSGVAIGGVECDAPDGWTGRPGKTWKQVISKEVERALWGRLGPLIGRLPAPYDLHPPAIFLIDTEFPHSKPAVAAAAKTELEPAPSTLSLSYIPSLMKKGPEVLYNGTRQSSTWKAPGTTLLKPKARSTVCKIETMWAYIQLAELAQANLDEGLPLPDEETTYHDLKHRFESPYQRAKTLIRGLPTTADSLHSAFGTIGPFDVTFTPDSQFSTAIPPFSGWIVSGKRFESFNKDAAILLPPHLYPTLPPPPVPIVREVKVETEVVGANAQFVADGGIAAALGINMAPPLTPPPEVLGLDIGSEPDHLDIGQRVNSVDEQEIDSIDAKDTTG